MPKVAGVPLLGALPELLRDQFEALRRWQRDYGGVFELDVGAASFIVVADANAASEMLVERHRSFTRGGPLYDPVERLFGQSMLTTQGEVWRTRRRAAQPRFRQQSIAQMADQVDRTVGAVIEPLTAGPRNVESLAGQIAMAVALRFVVGAGGEGARLAALSDAISFAVGRIFVGWASSRLPRWLPLPGSRRYRRSVATIDEAIADIIQRRRESGEYGDDFLAMFMHMADAGDLPAADIRNETLTLIFAGYETTATALAWTLYELARQPELLARARAEADALARGELEPTALRYAAQCFKEGLRMYPSGIWLPRHAAEDSELAGYPVKAGTSVLCSPYLVHHDPHAWTEPERFDPERFAEGSAEPRNRFAFMPFGLGPHMCIGLHLALLEGPLAIARILQRWELAPIPGREAVAKISSTMSTKDGIWLELRARTDG